MSTEETIVRLFIAFMVVVLAVAAICWGYFDNGLKKIANFFRSIAFKVKSMVKVILKSLSKLVKRR